MKCPHCEVTLFRGSTDKLKLSTRILILHKSGSVETNCPSCKRGILLPLQLEEGPVVIRKAQKLIARKT